MDLGEALNQGRIRLREHVDLSPFSLELTNYLTQRSSGFMERTYLTPLLRELQDSISRAMREEESDSVFLIDSPFGSGKTHTLITLYEIFSGEHRVVAIDGHNIEKSLWNQLDPNTDPLTPPGPEFFEKLLEKPTLLLIDELVVYLKRAKGTVVGNTDLAELTVSFLHSLLSAVKGRRGAVVLTLPGEEESYGEEVHSIMQKIRSITHRSSQIRGKMEFSDLVEVVRRQLFSHVELTTLEIKRKWERSYPFHPTLLAVMLEDLPLHPNFQFLRGALRTLLSFLRADPPRSGTVWIAGDLPVESTLYDELVVKLGLTSLGEKLREDLQQLPKELHPVVRTIFLKTVTRGGVGKEELAESLVNGERNLGDARHLVESVLMKSFYTHFQGGLMVFSQEQTELRQVVIESRRVKDQEVEHHAQQRFQRILGRKDFEVHVFEIGRLSTQRPNLIIPRWGEEHPEETLKQVSLRNNTFVLTPYRVEELRRLLKLEIAAEMVGVTSEFRKELDTSVRTEFFSTYRTLQYMREGELTSLKLIFLKNLDEPSKQILKQLVDKHILLDKLNPNFLKSVIGDGCTLEEIVDKLLRDSSLRAPTSNEVIETAVEEGQRRGMWRVSDENAGKRMRIEPVTEPDGGVEGIQLVTIQAGALTEFRGRKVVEYSHLVRGEDVKILREFVKSLNRIRLINRMMSTGFSVKVQGDGELEFSLSECPVETLHSSLKRLMPTVEQLRPREIVVEFTFETEGQVLTDELMSSLKPSLALGGELMLSLTR